MNPRILFLWLALLLLTLSSSARAKPDGFTVLHEFGSIPGDGAAPMGELVLGSDGDFYGTTREGGANGYGTIFKMSHAGEVTILHGFSPTDGGTPSGGLIESNTHQFYGTTEGGGGSSGGGVVFSITSGGEYTVRCVFPNGGGDGFGTANCVIQGSDGNFYGTTYHGGANGYGTIYRLSTAGKMITLYDFVGDLSGDGQHPLGNLLQGSDGTFYGTTVQGYGTIFSVTSAGTLTTRHVFAASGPAFGQSPRGLIQGTDGNFYGMTHNGSASADGSSPYGSNGEGTLYQLTPAGVLTTLYHFSGNGPEGYWPEGRLLQASNGRLYGATTYGGKGYGALFEYQPATGEMTTLHRFTSGDGDEPEAGLIQGGDGALYGVARDGGAYRKGTIFKITLTPVATLSAQVPQAQVGGEKGQFRVSLSSSTDQDVSVRYQIEGGAINGTDYKRLAGKVTVPAGQVETPIDVVPRGNLGGAAKRAVKLTLLPGKGYTVDGGVPVKVKLLAPGK